MPPDRLPDGRLVELVAKQQDRYQAVITRLASNQVQVKTWCVTALAGLTALAVNTEEPGALVVGLVVLVTFFVLDAYYLSLERHFRTESRHTADRFLGPDTQHDWRTTLTIEGPHRGRGQTWHAVRTCGTSLAVSPFYLGLASMLGVGLILVL